MKHTISENRQLFNIKAIAAAGKTPDKIAEGEFAIVDNATNQTVKPANPQEFPKSFRFISVLNGKTYYSFDDIKQTSIKNVAFKEYKAEQAEIWKGVIDHCSCIDTVSLTIHLNDESLISRDGIAWTHRDNFAEVTPQEFKCYCDCTGKSVYENHIMTKLLYQKIKAKNSPYYDVEVHVVGGSKLDTLEDIEQHIKNNKTVNTDDDTSNDTAKLELRIIGKLQPQSVYNNIERNYYHPRGVMLEPYLYVNDNKTIAFEKTQDVVFEVGNGVDLRMEEFSEMADYTNLLNRRTHDGFEDGELVYQFQNGVKYDTLTFEFATPKQNRSGESDTRDFLVLLGMDHSGSVTADIKAMFGIS